MLAATDRHPGGRPSETRTIREQVLPPALSALGVTRKEASRAEMLAGLPAAEQEAIIAGELTPVSALETLPLTFRGLDLCDGCGTRLAPGDRLSGLCPTCSADPPEHDEER